MTISISAADIIHILAILAGILILVKPKFLSYVVAIYLIVVGIIGIFGL
jgi:hypothetical protein